MFSLDTKEREKERERRESEREHKMAISKYLFHFISFFLVPIT